MELTVREQDDEQKMDSEIASIFGVSRKVRYGLDVRKHEVLESAD